MKWLILILGVLSNAAASVLIKVAVTNKETTLQLTKLLPTILNIPFVSAVALYVLTFLLYTIALVNLNVSIVHPILTSGSIAFVSIASVVFLGEKLSFLNIFGVVLIMVGVVFLTIKLNLS